MTVAELGVIGRPAVYIPLPTAADDHQRKNAEAMAARGAAKWIAQGELTPERLAAEMARCCATATRCGRWAPRRGRARGPTQRA
ncbi:MAG: hypothetical protein IPF99_34340 [Deltaproteobacteria bacterium]|nr:hypothetical protein [Deltaproteobacteria bacterium]